MQSSSFWLFSKYKSESRLFLGKVNAISKSFLTKHTLIVAPVGGTSNRTSSRIINLSPLHRQRTRFSASYIDSSIDRFLPCWRRLQPAGTTRILISHRIECDRLPLPRSDFVGSRMDLGSVLRIILLPRSGFLGRNRGFEVRFPFPPSRR